MSPRSDRRNSAGSAPVIGLTTYVDPVTRDPWLDQNSTVLAREYSLAVERSGGIPLLIVPREDMDAEAVETILDRLDGLILCGGADVEASRYGAQPLAGVQDPRRDRDETEILLAQTAQRRGLPALGICRGMQVMAVAAGGTLEQHVPDRVGHEGHSPTPGRFSTHPVATVPDTRIAQIVGERAEVPTYHHQSVLTHPGFTPAAWADDGTLEAMERTDLPFCLAVQWHPEMGADLGLFRALVEAARAV